MEKGAGNMRLCHTRQRVSIWKHPPSRRKPGRTRRYALLLETEKDGKMTETARYAFRYMSEEVEVMMAWLRLWRETEIVIVAGRSRRGSLLSFLRRRTTITKISDPKGPTLPRTLP